MLGNLSFAILLTDNISDINLHLYVQNYRDDTDIDRWMMLLMLIHRYYIYFSK